MGVAAVLGCTLHPLTLELLARLEWFFPELPSAMGEKLQALMHTSQPGWYLLMAMAVAPALCEELAFRGFILSGLQRSGRVWISIALSSLAFGFMHMIPQQVFNATLLGIVLGMLAVRSGSLLPCIVFHFCYNALGVLSNRSAAGLQNRFGDGVLFQFEDGHLIYKWPVLLVSGLIAGVLIYRLVQAIRPEAKSAQRMVQPPRRKPRVVPSA